MGVGLPLCGLPSTVNHVQLQWASSYAYRMGGAADLGPLLGCRGAETSQCAPTVELKFSLDQYVHKRYPGLVKIVRNSRREGLIRARLQGWKAATAPAVGFFDAHVEFSTGW